jgi:hypothetical protein
MHAEKHPIAAQPPPPQQQHIMRPLSLLSCSPHAADALVPALDHAASAQLKHDGVVAVMAAVKLGAISQAALQERICV